jgi:hypothetical protein
VVAATVVRMHPSASATLLSANGLELAQAWTAGLLVRVLWPGPGPAPPNRAAMACSLGQRRRRAGPHLAVAAAVSAAGGPSGGWRQASSYSPTVTPTTTSVFFYPPPLSLHPAHCKSAHTQSIPLVQIPLQSFIFLPSTNSGSAEVLLHCLSDIAASVADDTTEDTPWLILLLDNTSCYNHHSSSFLIISVLGNILRLVTPDLQVLANHSQLMRV